MNNQQGYTLAEVMMAMAVFAVVMTAVYASVNAVQRGSSALERKVAAQQDVKPALNIMAMEISMASYNPSNTTVTWLDLVHNCADGNQNYRGIQEATESSMTLEMDLNGNRTLNGTTDTNEIIRYNYDTDKQYITRKTACKGTPQPFLGDTEESGRPKTVRVINPTDMPVFRYFDDAGNPLRPNFELPAAIPDIRRIQITLAVETEDIDLNTRQRRKLIYSTSVIPRNHAITP